MLKLSQSSNYYPSCLFSKLWRQAGWKMTLHVWLLTSSHLIIVQHPQHCLQRKIRTSWNLLFLVGGLIVLSESSANLLHWALWKKYLRRDLQCWKKGMFLFCLAVHVFLHLFCISMRILGHTAFQHMWILCCGWFVPWYSACRMSLVSKVRENNTEMLDKFYCMFWCLLVLWK
jgi:hypothetical protein